MRQDAEVAAHEAGHGLIAIAVGLRIRRVSIIPNETSIGHCLLDPWPLPSKPGEVVLDRLQRLATFIAGSAAANLLGGKGAASGDDDDRRAEGYSAALCGDAIEVAPLVERALRQSVERYLRQQRAHLERLASALFEERVLSGERVHQLVADIPRLDLGHVERLLSFLTSRLRAARAAAPQIGG